METTNSLDLAHRAMRAAPDDDGARLAYYRALAACELYLLLDHAPLGDEVQPQILTTDDGALVLAFDSEERLAGFSDRPQPYAALPGRVILGLLATKGLALGVNLATDDCAFLVPPEAIDWIDGQLHTEPASRAARPTGWHPHPDAPALATRLALALAGMGGLARCAWLVNAAHADGTTAPALILQDADPADEAALAKAGTEALAFSGLAQGRADVFFMDDAQFTGLGLRHLAHPVALSAPPAHPYPAPHHPSPPGSDPARPPRLK